MKKEKKEDEKEEKEEKEKEEKEEDSSSSSPTLVLPWLVAESLITDRRCKKTKNEKINII